MRILAPKTAYLFLAILTFASSLAFGWTTPKRLTYHLARTDPQAVSHSRDIDLVAWGSLGSDFPFLRSWNYGYGWSDPIEPADTMYGSSIIPDIEYTPNGLIHMVWKGKYQGQSQSQIFHQSSSDGGRTWSNRHQVFNSGDIYAFYPRLASNGDTLFLTFRTTYYLLFFRSFDSGVTWRDSTVVDISDGMLYRPTIIYSGGRLHLIYELGFTESGFDVYYSQSDDLGLTWTPRISLSSVEIGPPFLDSQFPSAYADENDHIVAAWFDYKYGDFCGGTGDILGRISTDNGDSWLPETRIIYTQTGSSSSCLILSNIIYIAWMDDFPHGCGFSKILLATSSDWGTNWSDPEMIGGNGYTIEQSPFLLYSLNQGDTMIHCLYDIYDPSHGSDIFYIRNKPFFATHIPLPPDQRIYLSIKAHPNVFNSSTLISIDNQGGGDVEVEIYNILGQRTWAKTLNGKEGQFIWDATDMNGNGISSGTYFVRATSGGNSQTIKLNYLK